MFCWRFCRHCRRVRICKIWYFLRFQLNCLFLLTKNTSFILLTKKCAWQSTISSFTKVFYTKTFFKFKISVCKLGHEFPTLQMIFKITKTIPEAHNKLRLCLPSEFLQRSVWNLHLIRFRCYESFESLSRRLRLWRFRPFAFRNTFHAIDPNFHIITLLMASNTLLSHAHVSLRLAIHFQAFFSPS